MPGPQPVQTPKTYHEQEGVLSATKPASGLLCSHVTMLEGLFLFFSNSIPPLNFPASLAQKKTTS